MNAVQRAYLQLTVAAVLWGGAAVASKAAVGEVSPLTVAFLRFAIGAAFLLALLAISGDLEWRSALRHAGMLGALGVSGISAPNILFLLGIQTSTAAKAAMLQAGIPVVTALLALPILGERLSFRQWAGMGLSVVGVVGLLAGDDPAALLREGVNRGDLLIGAAVVCWGVNSLVAKAAVGRVSALAATTYASVVAAASTAPLLLGSDIVAETAAIPGGAWPAIVFLGLGPSALAFVFFYRAIGQLGASLASIYLNLTPVAGVVLSVLLLGERVTLLSLAAGALVVAGVTLTTSGQSANRPESPPAKTLTEDADPAALTDR